LFLNRLPPELTLSPLNPVFPDISKAFTKADLERLRDFLEKLILDNEVEESILLVARIEKRSEVLSCFPRTQGSLEPWDYYEALSAMPRIKGAFLFYHFGHDLGPWYLGFSLASELTWEQVKQSINLRRLEKSPSEKYGLTKLPSDLLSWLLSKNYDEFDLHLSPDVEDNLKLGIGIDLEKIGKKNLRQLFNLLCQEITGKTEFEAKPVPWAEGFYDPTIHIFFRKKLDPEEEALRAVQSFLGERGIERKTDCIRHVPSRLAEA
jgi:hypothetical protein